jgi:hypothetical protein
MIMHLRIFWLKTNGKILLLSLCLSVALAACAPSADSESGLTMSLALEHNTYQFGQPISATLTLENTSSTPLLFQARMVLNMRQLCPTESCDLFFVISDPMGKELEFQWLARVRSIEQNDFEEISPGEQRQFQVNLPYYYASFDKPGQYTVRAVYGNQTDPGDGRSAWKGKLTSKAVTFTIEP